MKKIVIIALLLLVGITSCNEEDKPKTSNELIVGTWVWVKFVETCVGENPYLELAGTCESESRLTFNADGTFLSLDYYLDADNVCIGEEISGTWGIINETLTIIPGNESANTFDIFEVDANQLKIGKLNLNNSDCEYYTELNRVN